MLTHLPSLFLALLYFTLLPISSNLLAGDELSGKGVITIDPWSRPAPPVAVNGAAYLSFHNIGPEQDRLIGARSSISDRVEIHDHIVENGLMKMRHIKDGISLHSGEKVALKPGGKHLMLLGLNEPLVEGESFQLILQFEKAGERVIEVEIQEKPAAEGHGGHTKEHGQSHDENHGNKHDSTSASHEG